MQQGSSSNVSVAGASAAATLTDEQILGLEAAPDPCALLVRHSEEPAGSLAGDEESLLVSSPEPQGDSSGNTGPRNDDAVTGADPAEPAWLRALDASAIPNGGEAAAEARRWRQAALDAAALDKDYFSAEPGARAALAARLHADDPAAFRAMLADAARVLAERDPHGLADLARQFMASAAEPLGGASAPAPDGAPPKSLLHAARSASQPPSQEGVILSEAKNLSEVSSINPQRDSSADLHPRPQNDNAPAGAPGNTFPADAYRAFESAVNHDVARQVRDSIDRTLAATLPDGIADGARRRIGDDVFRDLNATLSADRQLSGQISELLRSWRFDAATRQQLAGLLTGRARTALPEVARRVVSEWTSSVLASDRIKQARIESAIARRDISGGRLPEPVASTALLPRRLDYARTSDEQILEM